VGGRWGGKGGSREASRGSKGTNYITWWSALIAARQAEATARFFLWKVKPSAFFTGLLPGR